MESVIKKKEASHLSNLQNDALLEFIHDTVWEEYRVKNNLTEDQLNELCWQHKEGTLPYILKETNKRFEDLCQ